MRALEKKFQFKYLTKSVFESEEKQSDLLLRGKLALEEGKIAKSAIAMGEMYRTQIELHYFPKVHVYCIDAQIGCGLFADEKVFSHQYVGEYTGLVRENNRRYCGGLNNYCYEYPIADDLGRSHVIDATDGSYARFINHSSKPNLKPTYAFIDGLYHLIFIALRDIDLGEQFCYDYGPSYWYIRSAPLPLTALRK